MVSRCTMPSNEGIEGEDLVGIISLWYPDISRSIFIALIHCDSGRRVKWRPIILINRLGLTISPLMGSYVFFHEPEHFFPHEINIRRKKLTCKNQSSFFESYKNYLFKSAVSDYQNIWVFYFASFRSRYLISKKVGNRK